MKNDRLRIAWDNSIAGQDHAGTGMYASRLVSWLRETQDVDLEMFEGPQRTRGKRSPISLGKQVIRQLFWYHGQFPRALRRAHFDLIHCPAFVVPLWCPCPSVVTVHDLTALIFPRHFDPRWRMYVNAMMPHVLRLVSAVICVSANTKQDLLKFYKVSHAKVHVVHNGVDRQRFHPGVTLDHGWARQAGLRDGYLLHVGTFSYRKNIPTLLRAIAHLRSKGKWGTRQLVLAGSERSGMKGAQEIYETLRELDLESSVIVTGHVPDEHVPGLYAHASVLVMPSLYEGFGFPVLESMAVGTPVIASDTSSLPEVGGDAAIYFPPRDELALASAIEDVLEKKAVADELQRKGLVRAAQFSWQRCAEETVKVYRSIV